MSENLDQLEHQILHGLSLIQEGRSLTYDRPNLHRAHPAATPPPGAQPDRHNPEPDPLVSLLEYHRYRLDQARDRSFSHRLTTLAEAAKDLETSRRRGPRYISPDSAQNSDDRDQAILRWHGKRPEWVAVFESCSASYVRKVRKHNELDQTSGEPHDLEKAA